MYHEERMILRRALEDCELALEMLLEQDTSEYQSRQRAKTKGLKALKSARHSLGIIESRRK